MSEEFNYYIIENRIYCGDCSKSYKLKNDGLPPNNFFGHQYVHCRVSSKSCIEKFLKKYKKDRERKRKEDEDEENDKEYVFDVAECSICYENIVSGCCSIPCNHKFHLSCLKKMNNDMCPLCRCDMGINKQVDDNGSLVQVSLAEYQARRPHFEERRRQNNERLRELEERRLHFEERRRQNNERLRELGERRRELEEKRRQLEEEQRKMRNIIKKQETLMEIFNQLDQERTTMYENGIYDGPELDTINERIHEILAQGSQSQQIINEIQQRINEILAPRIGT
jgi:DNA repair exonuclease SbcCD ATPase subunit